MKTYKLQLQTTTGGLPWEYNTEFASDAMALEYAKRVVLQFAHVPWFMYMIVWRMDGEELIGTIKLNDPTATIIMQLGKCQ